MSLESQSKILDMSQAIRSSQDAFVSLALAAAKNEDSETSKRYLRLRSSPTPKPPYGTPVRSGQSNPTKEFRLSSQTSKVSSIREKRRMVEVAKRNCALSSPSVASNSFSFLSISRYDWIHKKEV